MPAFLFGGRCPYRLFDADTCRLAAAGFTTVTVVNGRQVTLRGASLAGQVANGFAEGWLTVGTGLQREIRLVLSNGAPTTRSEGRRQEPEVSMSASDSINPVLLAAAQRWLGTPFREHAHICGAGVDCVQLAAAILEESGLAPACDLPTGYPVDFGEHAEASPLLEWFTSRPHWQEMSIPADLRPGDVLLFRVGKVVNYIGVALGD